MVGFSRRSVARGCARVRVDPSRRPATALWAHRFGLGPRLRPAGDLEHLPGPGLLFELRQGELPRHSLRAHFCRAGGRGEDLAEPRGTSHLLVRRPRRHGAGSLPVLPRHPSGGASRDAVAGGRAVDRDSLLGRRPGSGARLLSPREHGPRVRAARGLGANPRPPRRDVVLLRPHAQLQGGPGVHDRGRRAADARVWGAAGQEAVALHPLYGGWLVPDRNRDRATALPERRLHGLRLLPLALRTRPDAAAFATRRARGAVPTRGSVGGGRAPRRAMPDAIVCPALAAFGHPPVSRERAQRAPAAERAAPALRAAVA